MPRDADDNQEGQETSTQAADVTNAPEVEDTASPAKEAGAAGSSPAEDVKPEDMASVVRDVVAKSEDAGSSTAKKEVAEDEGKPEVKDDAKSADDTDYKDVPFHTHPRFQQLLKKSKAYEADAGRYRNIEQFLSENHLNGDEAAEGFQVMALAKTDPKAALERLKPFVQQLLLAAGEVLPDDLKQRVQSGEIPAAAAQEISRTRAQLAQREQAAEIERQRVQEADRQSHAVSLRTAAGDWLQDRDVKDPSFKAKYPLLEREVAFMQRSEGIPNTVEGVRDQLNRAYQTVNQQARAAAPAATAHRPAVRPVTGGAAPGNPAPQPKTMLEAVRMGRGAQ